MSLPLLAPEPDAEARRRLARAKAGALALLCLAGVVYLLTFLGEDSGWVGFVRAGAEAAMVGGLADWFAVTALFRHPLGIPVPHTALVPRQKDALGRKLGEFVTGHFVTAEAVTGQLREARVVSRLASWLAEPAVALRLSREVSQLSATALESLDDDSVVAWTMMLLHRDAERRSYAPVLARLLETAVDGGAQTPFVDVLVRSSREYVERERAVLAPELKRYLEQRFTVLGLLATDKRVARMIDNAAAELRRVEATPDHPVRVWLEGVLRTTVGRLRHDPAFSRQLDAKVAALLADPRTEQALRGVVVDAVTSVRESLAGADAELTDRIAGFLVQTAARYRDDEVLLGRLEDRLDSAVGFVVERYGTELTSLIGSQVERWDARSASDRIELAVGRDLQFIRVNGTVVGALAGLAIHAVAVLVG